MALRGASCTRLANSEEERHADTENLTVSGIYFWVIGFISPLDILSGSVLLSRNKVEGLSMCPLRASSWLCFHQKVEGR